jgi:hypothetical protein
VHRVAWNDLHPGTRFSTKTRLGLRAATPRLPAPTSSRTSPPKSEPPALGRGGTVRKPKFYPVTFYHISHQQQKLLSVTFITSRTSHLGGENRTNKTRNFDTKYVEKPHTARTSNRTLGVRRVLQQGNRATDAGFCGYYQVPLAPYLSEAGG